MAYTQKPMNNNLRDQLNNLMIINMSMIKKQFTNYFFNHKIEYFSMGKMHVFVVVITEVYQ